MFVATRLRVCSAKSANMSLMWHCFHQRMNWRFIAGWCLVVKTCSGPAGTSSWKSASEWMNESWRCSGRSGRSFQQRPIFKEFREQSLRSCTRKNRHLRIKRKPLDSFVHGKLELPIGLADLDRAKIDAVAIHGDGHDESIGHTRLRDSSLNRELRAHWLQLVVDRIRGNAGT